jgi:hypothetical protein
VGADGKRITPENEHLFAEVCDIMLKVGEVADKTDIPCTISTETEKFVVAEIRKALEGKTLEQLRDLLAISVYMNIVASIAAPDDEEVG